MGQKFRDRISARSKSTGKASATLFGPCHPAAIALDGAIGGVRLGQGIYSVATGEGEQAAGYLGEAALRLFGLSFSIKNLRTYDHIRNIGDDVKKWLGKDARVATNEFGDTFVESADGLRQVRFDFKHLDPHANPHTHLIEYKWVKNKKVKITDERIYPSGVTPE